MTTGKAIALTIQTCVSKVWIHESIFKHVMKKWYFFTSPNICIYISLVALFFCDVSGILFSVCLMAIHSDFGAQEKKICHCFHFTPSICKKVIGLDAMILVFWMLSFKPDFSFCPFTLIKQLFSSSSLSAIRVVYHLHIWDCWYFSQQSWFQLVIHPACDSFTWCTLHRS